MNIFGIGLPEMAVIMIVGLLIFGPKKLPEMGKAIAKTLRSFQEASKEFEREFKREAAQIEESVKAQSVIEPSVEPTIEPTPEVSDRAPSIPEVQPEESVTSDSSTASVTNNSTQTT